MADLADLVDLLQLGVLHPVAALEDRVGEHVDVLVDRPGDEEAAVLAVVGGQIGSAAAERDPQRGAAEDHAHRARVLVIEGPSRRGLREASPNHPAHRLFLLIGRPSRRGLRGRPRPGLARRARSRRATPGCAPTACSIVSCGRQPRPRMRAVSRWIRGLSPVQPRAPPVCSIRGARPRCSLMIAIESSTTMVSSVAQVVDVRAGLVVVALGGRQHRVEAVLHVQVGLLLAAVAQHPQAGGVALQRAVEVEHVPVGVALAEDRDEAGRSRR